MTTKTHPCTTDNSPCDWELVYLAVSHQKEILRKALELIARHADSHMSAIAKDALKQASGDAPIRKALGAK